MEPTSSALCNMCLVYLVDSKNRYISSRISRGKLKNVRESSLMASLDVVAVSDCIVSACSGVWRL